MDDLYLTDYCRSVSTQYPKYISLNQLYRICRISKRSASYLVNSGIIPAIVVGCNKTWRYRIATEDAINYLQHRVKYGTMIPMGALSNKQQKPISLRKTYAEVVSECDVSELSDFFSYICSDYPDMLTTYEVMEISGLSSNTICRHIRNGDIKAFRISTSYMMPKISVINFMASPKFIDSKSSSELILTLIKGFEAWMSHYTTNSNERSNQ
jgi:hypothetical protein